MNTIPSERITIREAIMVACGGSQEWNDMNDERKETLVRRIERGCFEVCIEECKTQGINRQFSDRKFLNRYSAICSKVIANLDLSGSIGSIETSELVTRVVTGELDPHSIARLTSRQLCPAASDKLCKEIEMRKNQKAPHKVSRSYTCRKCERNETIPRPYQSRAADESESTSIKCVHCFHTWRI